MKVAKNKVAPTTDLKLSDSLAEAFGSVESAVHEGTLEFENIDNDIRALLAKLKSLNFQGMELESAVEMSDTEDLSYDYSKKSIYYKIAGQEGKPVLGLPIKLKKQIHDYYLPELLAKITDDYKAHRASMG